MPAAQAQLVQLLQRLEQERRQTRRFGARAELSVALDALVLHVRADRALQQRAARMQGRLEARDERFFSRVCARLRSGRFTPRGLMRGLARHAARDGRAYDALDVLLAGLLDAGELPAEQREREPEMVAYQPTPGRVILELVEHVQPSDVFYDLGSGLGRVLIMVALLCGARVKGVEIEPAFCAYAGRSAARVNARGVELIAADVREVPLTDGTVFFLYTPFRGALLRGVLAKLRATAEQRPIRVCSYGPCTIEVAQEPWLQLGSGALDADSLAVFHSRRG